MRYKNKIAFIVSVVLLLTLVFSVKCYRFLDVKAQEEVKASEEVKAVLNSGNNLEEEVKNSVNSDIVEEISRLRGYRVVGETSSLKLYYSEQDQFIMVVDKVNNFVWSSPSVLGEVDSNRYAERLLKDMGALFNFSYSNIETNTGQIVSTNSLVEKAEVTSEKINNGVILNYSFTDLGISFSVEIYVEGDSLVFRVPEKTIVEKDKWLLVSIEPLPYLGASEPGKEGYIFYPDGSGALFYLNKKPKDTSKYTFYVYGTDKVDFREFRQKNYVMLPVFGIKRDNNAFLAIITEGEYDAAINLYPANNIVYLNRISAEFTYRRLFRDPRIQDKLLYRLERNIIRGDRELRYIFLRGDDADYSGMANVYRDYLLNNNEINKVINADDKIPVSVNFFMGIVEERILFDKYIAATKFEEVKSILERMVGKGVEKIDVNLIGWEKGGYGQQNFLKPTVDRHLGGKKAFYDLNNYVKENGLKLYLQCNFAEITDKSKGFTPRKDMVYEGNGMVVTNMNRSRYLFNAAAAWEKFTGSYLLKVKDYKIDGLNFEFFGYQLYHDYNENHPLSRQQAAEYWVKMLDEAKKELGYVSVRGGNAYVLRSVSRLFDIPMEDNGYFVTDESIPFYQMVVHGLIPYTSPQPANLFYDFERQKLKWVEYGYMPYFELTYQKPNVLKNTRYNNLFSSYYEDWVDTAVEMYKEFNERLGEVWSKKMVEHQKLGEDVYVVTYEDGTKVYVNYGSVAVQIGANTIKPMDYLVVSKEGHVK